ncbi:MAG: MBL fold metallo-hydrolase [Alphaproteobacteria bacterium]|jgi:glyoxylase-like metal-dependent hydrolase (beta-lactamase superfamily II)|nr:MBL fold metallo-hydrolase [Alphaproteobacteria bacterium]MDP6874500.1 MBL fold metallo-hydrolase [Alphaproteobacteria bacterium]
MAVIHSTSLVAKLRVRRLFAGWQSLYERHFMVAENEVEYPYEDAVELGRPLEVAPGVFWLRMPLELTGLDHINLWLLRDGAGWCIVDTGMKSSRIHELWEEVFEKFLDDLPITRVFCTHFHPDHIGQAGWLTRRWNCDLWMTHREWLQGRVAELDHHDKMPDWQLQFFRNLGLSKAALGAMAETRYDHFQQSVTALPPQVHSVRGGQEIRIGDDDWQVIVGRGHSPEHLCLFNHKTRVLISGDQILPRITPHIGLHASEPAANPLQLYLDTLSNFDHLPADTLVLPAHGLPFYRLHPRLAFLREHHAQRLSTLEEFCIEPTRVLSTLKVMFQRELNPFEALLGMSEALAHLHCLMGQGRIVRETSDDGVWLYQASGRRADAA